MRSKWNTFFLLCMKIINMIAIILLIVITMNYYYTAEWKWMWVVSECLTEWLCRESCIHTSNHFLLTQIIYHYTFIHYHKGNFCGEESGVIVKEAGLLFLNHHLEDPWIDFYCLSYRSVKDKSIKIPKIWTESGHISPSTRPGRYVTRVKSLL